LQERTATPEITPTGFPVQEILGSGFVLLCWNWREVCNQFNDEQLADAGLG